MSEWLDGMLADGGDTCGNCGEWRIVKRHRDGDECAPYVEACTCGDEAYEVFATDEIEVP